MVNWFLCGSEQITGCGLIRWQWYFCPETSLWVFKLRIPIFKASSFCWQMMYKQKTTSKVVTCFLQVMSELNLIILIVIATLLQAFSKLIWAANDNWTDFMPTEYMEVIQILLANKIHEYQVIAWLDQVHFKPLFHFYETSWSNSKLNSWQVWQYCLFSD